MRYHKDLKMGCLHRFLHAEAVLVVMAKESSNPRWWVLYFNTIARRPLLLRQQAEIKVVSTGNTPGGVHWFAALMFLLSSSSSLETQPPLLPFDTQMQQPERYQAYTPSMVRCTHSLNVKTNTSGNNDHERDTVWNCRGCFFRCTTALMLKLGKTFFFLKQHKWSLCTGWRPL